LRRHKNCVRSPLTAPEAPVVAEKFVINIDLGGDDNFVLETEIVPLLPSTEEEKC
jgi:hypothetical protein